jgi:hypothetical protein
MQHFTPMSFTPLFRNYHFQVKGGACLLQKFRKSLLSDDFIEIWDEVDRLAEKFIDMRVRIEVFDEDDRLIISVGSIDSRAKFKNYPPHLERNSTLEYMNGGTWIGTKK